MNEIKVFSNFEFGTVRTTEIENKTFSKQVVSGYNVDEVKEFDLEMIIAKTQLHYGVTIR